MANFAPSFSKVFTNTCQNLKVTDTSNYGNNTQGLQKTDFVVRQVTLRDIAGNTLETKDIPATQDFVEFDLALLSFNQVSLSIGLVLGGAGVFGYDLRVSSLLPCILP